MDVDQSAQVSVAVSDLDALVVLVAHLTERVDSAFAEGYGLGYEGGYDHGEVQALTAEANAWTEVAQSIRDLGKPDDWERRVRAAETYCHVQALHQWSNQRAWKAVMDTAPGMAVAVASLAGRP